MDFDQGSGPLASARAALLLTYYSPHYNVARINTHWLLIAARFAKVAGADTFYLIKDKSRSLPLKRLWWSLLFRDRIMSLGLRRTMTVHLDVHLRDDIHVLTSEDFEKGSSKVHTGAVEEKLLESVSCMCRLVQALTPGIDVLYRHETLNSRVTAMAPMSCLRSIMPYNHLHHGTARQSNSSLRQSRLAKKR